MAFFKPALAFAGGFLWLTGAGEAADNGRNIGNVTGEVAVSDVFDQLVAIATGPALHAPQTTTAGRIRTARAPIVAATAGVTGHGQDGRRG
jgi:hypothetical protein